MNTLITIGLGLVVSAFVLVFALRDAKPAEIVAGQWYGQANPYSEDVALVTSINGEIVYYIRDGVSRKGTKEFFRIRYPYPRTGLELP